MKQIRITINGRVISGHADQTVLQVAQQHEIAIPTLCNFPGIESSGACRICIVEVVGYQRPLPACATLAKEGMVIRTDSEQIQRARKLIIELLLSERNHTCPVCIMNDNCELQSLAKFFGIDHVRYEFIAPRFGVDISHSHFGIDHNRCILCRRCIRVCDEVEGAHTWDVCGRGVESRIICDLAEPWGESVTCTDCGKCVKTCPTGALFEKGSEKTRKDVLCLESLLKWRGRNKQ